MSNTIVIGTINNRGSRLRGMELGAKIRAAREQKEWSQAELGRRIGISQVAVKKIESGETRQSKHLPRLAVELGIDIAELGILPPASPPPEGDRLLSRREIYDATELAIFAAAEGGPGEIIRSADPVDWVPRPAPVAHVREAYGLYVIGESMVPEYRPGDVALVNPTLPLIGGEVYIFYAEMQGEARATIKFLRRATSEKWLVSQHNKPKDFELPRRDWRWAHRVIGKYARQ